MALKITSTFAILDVKNGRAVLDRHFKGGGSRIPVTIEGFITCAHGRDDGVSIEFQVDVSKVIAGEPEPRATTEPRS